jgi:23S rRNA (cytosine1962-C5)-methyltransferase
VVFLVNPPCVIFEDDHLLVVNKPAGMNTHAPSPFAGEGIYDWLRHRESRWARLAIIHRLDKETSGVLVFSKTEVANRSLTEQFTRHSVRKKYLLLTDRPVKQAEFTVKSALARAGEKYVSRRLHAGGEQAETRFLVVSSARGQTLLEARPVTGKTHQIRVHAAASGFPILGDALYGGTPAARVHLHAAELTLKHPESGRETTFTAPVDFSADTRLALRSALINAKETNAYRLVHGAADGWPGWYVDRVGDFLLSQSGQTPSDEQRLALAGWLKLLSLRGAYHKLLARQVRKTSVSEASPQKVSGEDAPDEFVVCENGVRFALRFNEGYSVGLFLDQRDNRRRFLVSHVAAGFPLFVAGPDEAEVLNTFAYTCGFSVCAARSGARTTSLDLSKKYLEWGRRNFALNGLDASRHDFIYGDVFDWLHRLVKKKRGFDVIILDPPTFSQSKEGGTFQVEKDYGKLVNAAARLVKPNGVLFASTNAAKVAPEKFLSQVEAAIRREGRKILQQHYLPQPPDFPIRREEPACLKTVWLRIA